MEQLFINCAAHPILGFQSYSLSSNIQTLNFTLSVKKCINVIGFLNFQHFLFAFLLHKICKCSTGKLRDLPEKIILLV